jgi:peptidoglycan/LPS O-acetylase OafA/YrhL
MLSIRAGASAKTRQTSKATRLDSLDLLRGIAAFLVLSGHLRSYIFQSYGELADASLPVRAFYFTTGLGHQAVIIFFALSGFLVGGKALEDILNRRFSWSRYLLRRITRLWIVIIPALLLTMLLDNVGLKLTGGIGYDGRYNNIYAFNARSADDSFRTLLGNLAFLQTIYVPAFGSNTPMWSLANEFWYYITFPLALWTGLGRATVPFKTAALCILLVIILVIPAWLLEGGIIWVAGAAAAWCTRRAELSSFLRHFATRIAAIPLLFTAVVLTDVWPNAFGSTGLGIAVALTLPVLATLPSGGRSFSVLARASSELSYTLYLTHFPLLTLIVLVGLAPNRFPPGGFAAALYGALFFVALMWAVGVWWCFERNTDRIYSMIVNKLPIAAKFSVQAVDRRYKAIKPATLCKIKLLR